MVKSKNAGAKKEQEKIAYNIEVKRTKELDNGTIMFDMVANGVTIYGCSYKVLTRKDNGQEFGKVGFPSRKEKSGDKYYNEAYFPIDAETLEKIENGIQALIDEK